MKGTTWPRLSKQLTGPRDPNHCQSCGKTGSLEPDTDADGLPARRPTLRAWQEHDGNDHPEVIAVVLCDECSGRLIDKHPRLYRAIAYWEPFPGVMGLCTSCLHRDGTGCASPMRVPNGGDGLAILYPTPSDVHFYRRGKGQRSGWEKVYVGPPRHCEGKVVGT